jgi:uncharacterized membrane protein (UPF0127 family)
MIEMLISFTKFIWAIKMKAKTKKIKVGGKVIEAEVCDTIFRKARGLMFRKRSKPLLFIFKKETRQPIHSFFCLPFRAIWVNKNKIVDDKIVKPYKLSVKPKEPFTLLIEILLNDNTEGLFIPSENRKI